MENAWPFPDLIHSNHSYTTMIQIFTLRALLYFYLQAKQLVGNLRATTFAGTLEVPITWWDLCPCTERAQLI